MIRVRRIAGTWAIARLAPGEGWPWWATTSRFASVTRTPAETSVVCEESLVPATVQAERGFALYTVDGPLPFDAVGILATLVQPLSAAGISLFSVSSYDTDYLLLATGQVARAEAAWAGAGLEVARD